MYGKKFGCAGRSPPHTSHKKSRSVASIVAASIVAALIFAPHGLEEGVRRQPQEETRKGESGETCPRGGKETPQTADNVRVVDVHLATISFNVKNGGGR